jgi:DNA-binding MarR family transcriptional regulator
MGKALKDRIKAKQEIPAVSEAVFNLLIAAEHVRGWIEQACSQHGLTQAQYNVLRILRGAGSEGHSRCEIATRMIERAPDITRLIDRLETQGLAERVRSGEDRRLSITCITKKGLAVLDDLDPRLHEFTVRFAARLSTVECRELSRLCEKIYGTRD